MRILSHWLCGVCVCMASPLFAQKSIPGVTPQVLVYKTRGDYKALVPIILDEGKTRIMAYPDPKDLITGSGLSLPVSLHKGYLMDRRGIDRQSAFIKMTYKKYSQLKKTPSPDELFAQIVDNSPLTEMYNCGQRNDQKNSVKLINEYIDKGILNKKCKTVKLKLNN